MLLTTLRDLISWITEGHRFAAWSEAERAIPAGKWDDKSLNGSFEEVYR
jgi:hypothetical protein